MPSVVIPAHNEEVLIGSCLRSVVESHVPGLEVVVVPNACSDRTAEIARGVCDSVKVVETIIPGKTKAINLGECHVKSFPRLFLDGDIVLEPGTLSAIFSTLGEKIKIASPRPIFETGHSDVFVRLFYRSLSANSYFAAGAPNGSGAFAVTETGRSRWGEFPDVIADDGFVERHFELGEACTVEGPGAVVRAPATVRALIDIKTRARLGQMQLSQLFPDLAERGRSSVGGTFRRLLAKPSLWASVPVYAGVRVAERLRAKRQARKSGFTGWLRDDSSRTPAEHV